MINQIQHIPQPQLESLKKTSDITLGIGIGIAIGGSLFAFAACFIPPLVAYVLVIGLITIVSSVLFIALSIYLNPVPINENPQQIVNTSQSTYFERIGGIIPSASAYQGPD